MKCPECGKQNPNFADKCSHCFSRLNGITENSTADSPGTSALAISSLLLAILSIFTLCITALPAVILSIIALTKIKYSYGKLKGKPLAIAALCISILSPITLIILWSMDAPPIPGDYTIADLQSADPQYNHTYDLLLSLSDKEYDPNGAPAIGLNADDVDSLLKLFSQPKKPLPPEILKMMAEMANPNGTASIDLSMIDLSALPQSESPPKDISHAGKSKMLLENADTVRSLWQKSEKGRDVIRQLSSCDQIADLTEPSLESNFEFFHNCKKLCQIYSAYTRLESLVGNDSLAAHKLNEFDVVFRRLSINARSIISKLTCYTLMSISLDTANFLVNNPDTTDQTLQYLADHFPPLTEKQVSMINPIKAEYLMFKNTLSGNKLPEEVNVSFQIGKMAGLLKLNSTLRLYRNICDEYIRIYLSNAEPEHEQFSVWPFEINFPDVSLDSDYELPGYYFAYNPAGCMMIMIMTPAMEKIFQINTRVLVIDDLFQIVLSMRMGTEYSLKARAYDDEYIIDLQRKIIYSTGPDGEPFTDDDIKLEINPDVLGLTEQGVNSRKKLTEQK